MKAPVYWISLATLVMAAVGAEPLIGAARSVASPTAAPAMAVQPKRPASPVDEWPPYPAPQVDEGAPPEALPPTF